MYHCEHCDRQFDEPVEYEYDYCRYAHASPCCLEEYVIKDEDGVVTWTSWEGER